MLNRLASFCKLRSADGVMASGSGALGFPFATLRFFCGPLGESSEKESPENRFIAEQRDQPNMRGLKRQ
jgi:hypothetical protein